MPLTRGIGSFYEGPLLANLCVRLGKSAGRICEERRCELDDALPPKRSDLFHQTS